MRRSLALVGLLGMGIGGCSDVRSLFSANAGAVADVGGQKFTAEQLSKILTAGRGSQADKDAAERVTRLWIDHALFAQAAVTGALPTDSASIAEVAWSDIAETRARRWHDTLVARRGPASLAQADTIYEAGNIRVLQHILFRAAPTDAPAAKEATKKKANATLAQIRGGADFGALALKLSEDPGSKADSGYLPPVPRGKFVATFDSTGWALAPGAVSGVVESPFGYHIIKRPAREAVRTRLAQVANQRLDSLYMDSLATANKVEVSTGAPAAMREALDDPEASRKSSKTLSTYTNGKLTVGDFMRWMQALPPHLIGQLKQAPDSMLRNFARLLTQNTVLIRSADAAGIRLTADEWTKFANEHRGFVDTLRRELGLTDAEFNDSSLSKAERKKRATLKVDQYFDDLSEGKRRMHQISPAFAGMLRERASYRIYPTGLSRAVQLAKAKQAADSSALDGLGGPAMPAGPMQRAPGPPPIPTPAPSTPAPAAAPSATEKTEEHGGH